MTLRAWFSRCLVLLFFMPVYFARRNPTMTPTQVVYQNNTLCHLLTSKGCVACVQAGCRSCSQSGSGKGAFCYSGNPIDTPDLKYGACSGYAVSASSPGIASSTASTMCDEKAVVAASIFSAIAGSVVPCICLCCCVYAFVRYRKAQQLRLADQQWQTTQWPQQQPGQVSLQQYPPGAYPSQHLGGYPQQQPQYGYPPPPNVHMQAYTYPPADAPVYAPGSIVMATEVHVVPGDGIPSRGADGREKDSL